MTNGMFLVFNVDDGKTYKLTYEQLIEFQNTDVLPKGAVEFEQKKSILSRLISKIKGLFSRKKAKEVEEEYYYYEEAEELTEEEVQSIFEGNTEPKKDDMDVGSLTFDDLFKDLPDESYLDTPDHSEYVEVIVNLVSRYSSLPHRVSNEKETIEAMLVVVREFVFRLDSGESMCVHKLIMYVQKAALNVLASSNLNMQERQIVNSYTESLIDDMKLVFKSH